MAKIPDVTSLGERRIPTGRAPEYQDRSAEIAAESFGNAARQLGSAVVDFADRRDNFRVAKAGAAFSTSEAAARQFQDNDWESYESRYRESMGKAKEEALKGVRIPANRQSLELEFDSAVERGVLSVRNAARGKEVEFGRADLSSMLDSYRTAALSSGDEALRQKNVFGAQTAIKAALDNRYIDPTDAESINKAWVQSYGEGTLDTLPYAQQVEMLKKPEGTPAAFLAPDRRANLLRQAENALRAERDRAEAERRSNLIEVRQSLTDQLRDITVGAQMGLPVSVPSKAVLQSAFGEREGAQKYAIATSAARLSGDVAAMHQLPTDEIVSRVDSYRPGRTSDGLLDQVYAEYPGLSKHGFQFRDSPGKGGSRKLEFYPPGESHSPFDDKTKPGIERFDSSMGKEDVFGEMLHYLPSADKKVGVLRQEFQGSITQEQKEQWLRGDYENQVQKKLFGENPPSFEKWLTKQGGDAFFRGYLTKQYPAEAYTPAQKKLFETLDSYLREGSGDPSVGIADQAQLYGMVSKSAGDIIKQRMDDPAGYLTQFAPKTQSAWRAFQNDGSDEARDAYLSAVDADRERLGLPKGDILPNSYAKSLAEEIANPKSAEHLASLMEAEAQRWGDRWPDVHAQIAKDIPDMAAVIGSGIDRTAAVTLASTAKLKDKELQAMLPPSVKWGDVQADVSAKFDDVRRSFPAEGARTWEAIRDSAVRLSVSYMQAGDSKGNAINRAYKELIDKQYAVGEVKNVSFLVPRQFDAGHVEDAAARFISEFVPPASMIAVPAGVDPGRFIPRATEALRENAYWVSRGDGLGLRLYLGARPTAVTQTFQELQDAETAFRAKEQADVVKQRNEAMRARGPK